MAGPLPPLMTPTASELLALRHRVPDGVLLDWLDLAQLLKPPCFATTDQLVEHWSCSQGTVSRRLGRLWDAELLDYRPSRGGYRIRSIGPAESSTAVPLINEIDCAATDPAL